MTLTLAAWGVFGALAVWAQLPPPPTPTAPPSQVPLDGGVLLLAAAGAAYGAKKVYNGRKKAPK